MDGLGFVRGDHLSIADGCFLPNADLLGLIQARLHELVFNHPELKNYVPNMMDVDLFFTWDGDKFMLLVSPEKRGHLPARGMETKHLPKLREEGRDVLGPVEDFVDISEVRTTKEMFQAMQFTEGFGAAGIFPAGDVRRHVEGEEGGCWPRRCPTHDCLGAKAETRHGEFANFLEPQGGKQAAHR